MRIIRGKHSKKRIIAPNNLPVRPTTDMAKEALFNILDNYIYFEDVSVLDLFAGTGNISYEFGSRGSKRIVAVDIDSHCVRFMKSTVEDLEFTAQMQVIQSDVFEFLDKHSGKYDLIFADPPYDLENIDEIYDKVMGNNLLNEGGMLIIEHPQGIDLSDKDYFTGMRKYGKVHFSIFDFENE